MRKQLISPPYPQTARPGSGWKVGLLLLLVLLPVMSGHSLTAGSLSVVDQEVIFLPFIHNLPPDAPTFAITAISIPTYGYESGFIPTAPDDPVYPYPRLNFSMVGPIAPRVYQALVLENSFVAITVVPELGGRIYRWVDKQTGRHLLYENPVIKPTSWGYRGWWLATGGMEWSFPVDEHGLNEWRPWGYVVDQQADTVSITVSDVESRTGMLVGSTLTLDSLHSYIKIEPWAVNITNEPHEYQLWVNGMLTLGGLHVSEQTEFIFPTTQVMVHSTGDASLPPPGEWMDWPVFEGRDMSRYANWQEYLGFFAPNLEFPFTGLYDHEANQGMARVFALDGPPGHKIFAPKNLPPEMWTDGDSDYLELWSGATPTFWDYAPLMPGERVEWVEYWYPVNDLGSFQYANYHAALRLAAAAQTVAVGVSVTTYTTGHLTLWQADEPAAVWPVVLYPGLPFLANWTPLAGWSGPWTLILTDDEGVVLAQVSS